MYRVKIKILVFYGEKQKLSSCGVKMICSKQYNRGRNIIQKQHKIKTNKINQTEENITGNKQHNTKQHKKKTRQSTLQQNL